MIKRFPTGNIKPAPPVEHSMAYSTVTTGQQHAYYCYIRVDDGTGYMASAVDARSPTSQLDAKRRAHEELGKVIDRYCRVYDAITAELNREP